MGAEGLRAQVIFKGDRPPGDHGFDPMGFIPKYCDTPEKMELMKLKELKHARIAMIAITGFWFQLMLTGEVYPILCAAGEHVDNNNNNDLPTTTKTLQQQRKTQQ